MVTSGNEHQLTGGMQGTEKGAGVGRALTLPVHLRSSQPDNGENGRRSQETGSASSAEERGPCWEEGPRHQGLKGLPPVIPPTFTSLVRGEADGSPKPNFTLLWLAKLLQGSEVRRQRGSTRGGAEREPDGERLALASFLDADVAPPSPETGRKPTGTWFDYQSRAGDPCGSHEQPRQNGQQRGGIKYTGLKGKCLVMGILASLP